MFGRKIIIFCVFVSFVTGRAIDSEYDDSNTDLSGVKITRFHVATKIQMRYAITNVEVKVKNFDSSKTQEATFDMLIPEEAFVSNYTMIIKNETYVAKVEEKEEAKEIYQNSEGNTGLVRENYKTDSKDTKKIKFTAKVEANDEVTFLLTYEEQLQTIKDGINQYKLNINLNKEKVEDFKISAIINETLPLKSESILAERITDLNNEIGAEALTEAVIVFDEKVDEYFAQIDYVPDDADQDGEWEFILNYDVKRPKGGNEVQIGAGRFVHYFSPKDLPQLVKHIIFVIDVSGSMSGRKLKQTSDAMITILDNMNPEDSFDILRFSDEVYTWLPPNKVGNERLALPSLIEEAQENMLNLRTIGGTNINDALVDAVKKAKEVKDNVNYKDVKETMIIFLTDGEPTTGVTSHEDIIQNVQTENELAKVPIFGLAFGDGADFTLISEISSQNRGFARRIYESGNSFQQLENFYNEISDPKLKNVQFKYIANGKEIPTTFLTKNKIDQAFGKNEYTIIGEFGDLIDENDENVKLEIKVVGEGEEEYEENIEFYSRPCALPAILDDDNLQAAYMPKILCPNFPIVPPIPTEVYQKSAGEEFMQRLWAFKRIKDLIDMHEEDNCDEGIIKDNIDEITAPLDDLKETKEETCLNKAIELAKKYNFVTKFTSLVVEANEDYQNQTIQYEKSNPIRAGIESLHSGYYHSYAAAAPPPPPLRKMAGGSSWNKSGGYSNHMVFNKMASIPRRRPANSATASRYVPRTHTSFDVQHSAMSFDDYEDESLHSFGMPTTSTTTTTTTVCPAGKITLYSKNYFRAESVAIEDDVASLAGLNFDDKVQSINVEGCFCWRVYEAENFKGNFMDLRPKEYQSAVDIKAIFKKASSVAKISC